jgi:Protein of unknown function (DUF2809)
MNRRYVYRVLALFLFAVEVLIATKLSHLPFVRGSLGDVLVTMLLYFAALAFRDFERWRLAATVFALACLIEGAQYLHLAQALGLAEGSVLRVVIGDTFQWADILCYLIGTALALALDLLAKSSLR